MQLRGRAYSHRLNISFCTDQVESFRKKIWEPQVSFTKPKKKENWPPNTNSDVEERRETELQSDFHARFTPTSANFRKTCTNARNAGRAASQKSQRREWMLKNSDKFDTSKGANDGDENGGNAPMSTARISFLLLKLILKSWMLQKRQQNVVEPSDKRFQ